MKLYESAWLTNSYVCSGSIRREKNTNLQKCSGYSPRYTPRKIKVRDFSPGDPLTPTLGQKCGLERLAGGISRYGSKNGPPTVDSTEVPKMKRIP